MLIQPAQEAIAVKKGEVHRMLDWMGIEWNL